MSSEVSRQCVHRHCTSVDHSCGMQLRQLSSFMDFLLRWLALMALAQVRQVTQLVRVWSHLPRGGGGWAQVAVVQWGDSVVVGDGAGDASGSAKETSTASLTASVPMVKGVPAAARLSSSAKAAVAACW